MTRKLLLPVALVGVTAMGAFAAGGIGSEDQSAPRAATADNKFESSGAADTLHRVAKPSANASSAALAAAKKKGKKVKIQYLETDEFPIGPGQGLGDELSCPGKSRPLSGYFASFSTVDVAETTSVIFSKKSWFEGITHFGGDPDTAIIGVVCAKGVK